MLEKTVDMLARPVMSRDYLMWKPTGGAGEDLRLPDQRQRT